MRLSSLSSGFVFNLPSDFLPQGIISRYTPILEKNWVQYDNIIDYLNSTIKSINYPGLSLDLPQQTIMRGKTINFKPVTNVNDILTTRELEVTFRSVDNDLNYMLLWDILNKHYAAVSDGNIPSNIQYHYVNPFIVKQIDIHRDEIYAMEFRELIFKNLQDNKFSYSEQAYNEKEFSATFAFNWIDLKFSLDQSKILSIDGLIPVIQKLGKPNSGFGL